MEKNVRCKECKEWKNYLGGAIHLWDKELEGSIFYYIHDST